MADDVPANGADSNQARERPSWYVPIQPIPEYGTTAQDALLRVKVIEDADDLGDAASDIDAYLERILRKGLT